MTDPPAPETPRLKDKCRLQKDAERDEYRLLYPEGMLELNPTGYAILERVDGRRTLDDIVDELERDYATDGIRHEVASFLAGVAEQGLIEDADG